MALPDDVLEIIAQLKEHGYYWLLSNVFEKDPLNITRKLIPFLPIEALIQGDLNPLYIEPAYLEALFKLACVKMQRFRHPSYLTMDKLVELLQTSSKILVISGAGISTSAGIPDFRSANGLYAQLLLEYPELTEPQEMFDLNVFKENPSIFYSFAHKIYPLHFKPTISHKFILELEKRNKLLRNYTQNIDGLETMVGIQKVIQCHGSFEYAYCLKCNDKFKGDAIKDDIFNKQVPICKKCPTSEESPAIIKPCITFFHENLPQTFDDAIEKDVACCDLVIVMGSSLKVAPVAELVHLVNPKVPQILLNREVLSHLKSHFDIHLLGDSDVVVQELLRLLKWNIEMDDVPTDAAIKEDHQFIAPHHYIFKNGKYEELASQESETSAPESASEGDQNSIAEAHVMENDELAGLYKDQEDMEGYVVARTKMVRVFEEDLQGGTSESEEDADFNPFKKKKLENIDE